MDIKRAVMMVNDLMKYHGLFGAADWKFKLTRSMTSLGAIKPRLRILCLSKPYAMHNSEDSVLDTILHEIAHVLTFEKILSIGNREWHGPIWKRAAREIGAVPETCASAKGIKLPTKWEAICSDCGVSSHRQRDPNINQLLNSYHPECWRKGTPNGGRMKWLCNGVLWGMDIIKVPASTIDAIQKPW
jgi:predicted SprT family Zn-dependent metalloprotease